MNESLNQINVIAPYWLEVAQTWVFDDPAAGLMQEPFVSGVPAMIDDLVRGFSDPRSGFRLLFSLEPFPGVHRRIDLLREEYGGHWYRDADSGLEGWLCPALQRYFTHPPQHIYVRAEPIVRPTVSAPQPG
jgi:hypothetical protein